MGAAAEPRPPDRVRTDDDHTVAEWNVAGHVAIEYWVPTGRMRSPTIWLAAGRCSPDDARDIGEALLAAAAWKPEVSS